MEVEGAVQTYAGQADFTFSYYRYATRTHHMYMPHMYTPHAHAYNAHATCPRHMLRHTGHTPHAHTDKAHMLKSVCERSIHGCE